MISTVYSAGWKTYESRNHMQVTKPLVVYQYNQQMGGVDIADQLSTLLLWEKVCQVVEEILFLVVGGCHGEFLSSI